MNHVPVLLNEILKYFEPKPNQNFIDCTVGQGGHTKAILEKTGPNGKVLGIDWDPKQIENCRENLKEYKDRLILENDSYRNLSEIINKNNFKNISGILIDLGFSSFQTEEGDRGFTFKQDEPLDMRYSPKNELTADIIINEWSEQDIERILSELGEENFAKRIAKNIVEERKNERIKTTFELVEIIKEATPSSYWHGRIHYATRTFQALRIAVNKELENLEKFLPEAVEESTQGGKLAVISFHSLEDRIVKNFFKQKEKENIIKIINKKPIEAGDLERRENVRSRSAKLRVIEKL